MLAGAEMSMGKGQSLLARMSISRRQHSWRLLYWYMVILQAHGVDMRIRGYQSVVRTGSMTFSSQHHPLLVRAHRRWYRARGKQLPIDIHLDKPTLCIWLTGALRRWAMRDCNSKTVTLSTPPCHPMSLSGLTSQLQEHLPIEGTKLLQRSARIKVSAQDAVALVDGMVPANVWRY